MTIAYASQPNRWPSRLVGLLRDLIFGTLICLSPLTAIFALGWQTRRMNATIRSRWDVPVDKPGWFLGPCNAGRTARISGGLSANIRNGLISFTGLAMLSLPFTVLWLGAWWAGWENSFNKAYEQAIVGPLVWFLGAFIALPILVHLPLALAHAAFEGRLGAFFEFRRIRSIAASAGWRIAWLALISVFLSIPFLGMRAIPVFIEDIVSGFDGMTLEAQLQIAPWLDLFGAALAFALTAFLRHRAAAIYAFAAPRAAAGRFTHLWVGHAAQNASPTGRTPTKLAAAIWLVSACLIWLGLPILIVVGQFINYDLLLWLTHPVFLLPWAG